MPVSPTHPGIYVPETSFRPPAITAVATSTTAFVGRARRGPVDAPTRCTGFGDFERVFGGLWRDGPLSYAVRQFFQNGGSEAIVVRVHNADDGPGEDGMARLCLGGLTMVAASPGAWGNRLQAFVTASDRGQGRFDLTILDQATGISERFTQISVSPGTPDCIDLVLREQSSLVRLAQTDAGEPDLPATVPEVTPEPFPTATGGTDGAALDAAAFIGDRGRGTGLQALLRADDVNLLCIPPDTRGGTLAPAVRDAAARLCAERRAFYIMDPPAHWDAEPTAAVATVTADLGATTGAATCKDAEPLLSDLGHAANAAVFFPRLTARDPLCTDGQVAAFPPCGAIAGVMARTDVARGVWRAPAGTEARLLGIEGLTAALSDAETAVLNPLAVNCLRSIEGYGHVIWGARTLQGADSLSSDYKYLSVRRMALFIEESLHRGTRWAVFEPNDEPLWAQIRLSVGSFMTELYRRGAFQGTTPSEAFVVRCDRTTTTQDDIDNGILRIQVAFAPLQPAEFVIIPIRQLMRSR